MEEKLSIDVDAREEKFSAHKNTYPKKLRLRKRIEYKKIFRSGKRSKGKLMCIDTLLSPSDNPRLGLTVSKRYGNAVTRNRFKRSVKESFRQINHLLDNNLQINIIPRYQAKFVKSDQICKEMLFLLSSYLKKDL